MRRALSLLAAAGLGASLTACAATEPAVTPTAESTPGSTGESPWQTREAPGWIKGAASDGASVVIISDDRAWISTDGRAWQPTTIDVAGGVISSVAPTGSGFVATGITAGPNTRATAWHLNGSTWTREADGPWFDPAAGYESTEVHCVTAHRGALVMLGDEIGEAGQRGIAWYSADGTSWMRAAGDLGPSIPIAAASWRDGLVAVGMPVNLDPTVNAQFWGSADGSEWAPIEGVPGTVGAEALDVAATPDTVVAVGDVPPSPDGSAWSGMRPGAWISTDGATWTLAGASSGLEWVLPATGAAAEPNDWAVANQIVSSDAGLIVAGAAGWMADSEQGPVPVARLLVWTSVRGGSWQRLGDQPALELNSADASGPSAMVIHQGKLLMFAPSPGVQQTVSIIREAAVASLFAPNPH